MNSQGQFTYCSPQIEKLWGFTPEEIIGKTPFDLMPPEERGLAMENLKRTVRSPTTLIGLETVAYDAQGNLRNLEINVVSFFTIDGALMGFRGMTKDVTEKGRSGRKIAEILSH
jgi:PAS domain S-box-containing protein